LLQTENCFTSDYTLSSDDDQIEIPSGSVKECDNLTH